MVRLADRLRPRLRRVQFHRGALDPPQLRALSRLPDVSGAAPLAAQPHPAAGLGARGGRRLLQLLSLFLLPGTLAAAEQPQHQDRKSDMSGKGGAVSVDTGARSDIQKKK